MRAIEIMIEQMERLEPLIRRNREQHFSHRVSTEEIVREFYNENTRLGQFELNYLNAIGKNLAPDATYEDGIVVTKL
jgi:hypothetical protein